jgi:hypothetical protein
MRSLVEPRCVALSSRVFSWLFLLTPQQQRAADEQKASAGAKKPSGKKS